VRGAGFYEKNREITVKAQENDDYDFKNWTEGEIEVSTEESYTFTVTENRVLAANFEEEGDFGLICPDGSDAEWFPYDIDGVEFNMRLMPGSLAFPTDIFYYDDTATVENAFWIAETEVTYELWHKVYSWATSREENEYYFANDGKEGSHGNTGQAPTEKKNQPVTKICWFDAAIWCNALTEYCNENNGTDLKCYYEYNGEIFRNAQDADWIYCYWREDAKGFRLPTSIEWEAAAWYWSNSSDGAKEVGQKPSYGNGLGLYDMSGNVEEWCDYWEELFIEHQYFRGGSWCDKANNLQIGLRKQLRRDESGIYLGFRLAKTE